MRSAILKLLIILVVLVSVVTMVLSKEIDLEKILLWEIIFIFTIGLLIGLFLKWRRSLRLEDTHISIQLLDD